jgi:hypothetical protein
VKSTAWMVLLLVGVGAGAAARAQADWMPFADSQVVQILTDDEDGERRETSVWITVLDGRGYVRTNDSRWLANIRRGSPVALRAGDREQAVAAREIDDPELAARVEQAFREKYGLLQRVMSALRMREPTVLELTAR